VTEETVPVSVLILDKEYRIACKAEERETLLQTSYFLDEKMREIRDSGKVIGTDRIAVMAALNLAHDLLHHQNLNESGKEAINRRIQSIREKIDIALSKSNQLEL
jgi:cell division protein ZapA